MHRGLSAGGAGSAAGGAPPACGQHDPPQVGRCALLERNKAAALSPHAAALCWLQ